MPNLRTSSYTIYVKLAGAKHSVLVHGYTGAIDLVERKTAEALRAGDYPSLLPNDFQTLIRRGYITAKTREEERTRVDNLVRMLQTMEMKQKTFTFFVAYDCNFACPYCFEGYISDNGKRWSQETFTDLSIDAAYQAIDKLTNLNNKRTDIVLYGGEPLLKKNYSVVRSLVQKGIERGFKFSAITNGYDLEAFKDVIGAKAIGTLQITLDGDEKTHNSKRMLHDGSGTFKKIADNISLALDLGATVNVRVNLSEENVKGLQALAKSIEIKKWTSYKKFKCSIAPINKPAIKRQQENRTGESEFSHCAFENRNEFSPLMKKSTIIEYLKNQKQNNSLFIPFISPDARLKLQIKHVLSSGGFFHFRSSFCSAHLGHYILEPRGGIYTCIELVGKFVALLGGFYPQLTIDEEQSQRWHGRVINTIPSCRECKYGLFCAGGCAAFAYRDTGSCWNSHCDEFPRIFHHNVREAFDEHLAKQQKGQTN